MPGEIKEGGALCFAIRVVAVSVFGYAIEWPVGPVVVPDAILTLAIFNNRAVTSDSVTIWL